MSSLPINPPARLLMGPGPITADPRVLRAMAAQLVGQYDPAMTDYMTETQALYRTVFGTANEPTLLVDGTARAGIEAALVSLSEAGDRVLLPIFGRFGHLFREIAERAGAEVHVREVEWGQVFTPAAIEQAIRETRPKLLAVVHGDTSTTMMQPLDEIGEICARHDVLFYTDVTASLGVSPVETDAWGLDAVTAGLQKCLAGPSGSAPCLDTFGDLGHKMNNVVAVVIPDGVNGDSVRALAGASEVILAIERIVRDANLIGTVGNLTLSSDAVNVIPGRVEFSLDLRGEFDPGRDRAWALIEQTAEQIGERRALTVTSIQTHGAPAAHCSPHLRAAVATGIRLAVADNSPPPNLFSMAGHDAMAIAVLTDIGMLFLRCRGGVSHHPDESVSEADVALALDAFEAAVLHLADQYDADELDSEFDVRAAQK